tara:strand:- start:1512 stop:2564 length:1053 start_codon:yes stop_codon:yes gene_type:complete
MLNIAHILSSLQVGGAERFVIDLCRSQKAQGDNPMIISLGRPGEQLESECDTHGVRFFSTSRSSICKLIQVILRLRKMDIVHIHSPYALKFLQMAVSYLKGKIIYTRHGSAPTIAEHWQKLHVKMQPFISVITFVSKEGMDNFQNLHRWQKTPCQVIDNGVLIKAIDFRSDDSAKVRIGSVGRMIPLKNQLGLFKALTQLTQGVQKNIAVHFFGDGECLTQLKDYRTKNLSNINVNFHGMVNDRDDIYAKIDVLVVCSETEGLSMVIIEAMANKIPVIATNVGGNPQLVLDKKTGWLFEYNDNEKLAEIIAKIVEDKSILKPLAEQAFNYISANFSIASSAKKYAEIYKK